MDVGKRFGVKPDALAGFQRIEDMERYASLLRYTGTREKEFEQRLASLEKSRVPEQRFASAGAAGSVPQKPADLLKYLGEHPEVEMTPEDMAILSKAGYG